MNQALLALVWDRARGRCEYCRLPKEHSTVPFEINHIIAKKHGGPTAADNLALACFFCNSAKGPNIAGLDPWTGKLTALFHPRRQAWSRHFRWDGPRLVGPHPRRARHHRGAGDQRPGLRGLAGNAAGRRPFSPP